jgi:hypothetical protein
MSSDKNMPQRFSWVEGLALVLLMTAVALFVLSGKFAESEPGGPVLLSGARAAAQLTWILIAVLCAAIGLSLFLVTPLLRLGPRAPLWLIPVGGAVLLLAHNLVCREDGPLPFYVCYFGSIGLGSLLVFSGAVLLIRRFQIFRDQKVGSGIGRPSQ